MRYGTRTTDLYNITCFFDSFGDLLKQAELEEGCWPEDGGKVRPSRRSGPEWSSWAGAETFEKAVHLGRFGWTEGAAQLWRRADASTRLRKIQPLPLRSYDVSGGRPDVPLFCAGDPACMITEGLDNGIPKPLIKIVWNADLDCSTQKESLWNYGAAILACVLGLESKGFRTRLAVLTSVYNGSSMLHHWTKTILKMPGDVVDVSKIAFAACHPAFMRRIAVSLVEQCTHPTWIRDMYSMQKCECVAKLLTNEEVYIPQLGCRNAWDSFETALAEVQKIFQAKVANLLPPKSDDWSLKAKEELFSAIRL